MAESNADDTYVLNRDFTASTRLNCQHYMWQQEIRFTLHLSIPEPASGAAIADVAAGTGVWLIEVAKQYPLVDCLGLDISTTQSPPKAWLPSNIDFKIWDFTEKPPADLCGRFDVVHIRLIGIIFDHEPIKVIQNIATLLKPGGYLQWEEMDLNQTVIATAGDAVKADAIVRMDAIMKTHGERIWVPKIADLLNSNGFQGTIRYDIQPDMSLLKFHTDMHVLAWAEIIATLPECSEKREQLSALIAEVKEEAKKGVGHAAAKLIFVAQRERTPVEHS
ncbi:MAG: hypothetical protein Q9171_006025 [Xanthocarpia ochracea]